MTNKHKVFCLDLDGTVYRGTEPIPEAVEFIAKLQVGGIEPYYITNNSSRTPVQIHEKLSSFGIKTSLQKIMTSSIAVAKYCRENYPGATVMVIGEDGLQEALNSAGITIVQENPDIVIMGIDRQINYEKLAAACLAIRAGAQFIATNSDKAIPTERGLLPGNGSFVKLVENATGKSPIYIGKPASHMLEFIQTSGGYKKEDMVMIGDNYDTDILFGIDFGIDTFHVEGGVTPREEVLLKEKQPTKMVRTLQELTL